MSTSQHQEDQRTSLQVERITALHQALKQEELRLYFQPVVFAESLAVVGHEALLRWLRPSGIVSPLHFIPLAESSGLGVPIGRWVMRQAVSAVKTRRLKRVAVSVSALEIQQPDFISHLRWALEDSGIEPKRLVLELTESGML